MGLKHPPHLAKADASARASSLAFSRESWAAVTISAPSMRQSSRLTIVAVCGSPPPRAARSACVRRPSSVALTKTLVSPESGIKKPSYRGHLPVVIRKAGLNGPPGLGKPGREPFQLWSINRRPQTHARPPRFWSGHVLPTSDRVRQTSLASPNAVAPAGTCCASWRYVSDEGTSARLS
jgi:hypothetical protein